MAKWSAQKTRVEQHGDGSYHPDRPSDNSKLNKIIEINRLKIELGKLESEFAICIKKGYPTLQVKKRIKNMKHKISLLDGTKIIKPILTVRPDYNYGSFACWPPRKRRLIRDRIKEIDKVLAGTLKDTERKRLKEEKNRIFENEKDRVLEQWR